jgi:hypothetical protein
VVGSPQPTGSGVGADPHTRRGGRSRGLAAGAGGAGWFGPCLTSALDRRWTAAEAGEPGVGLRDGRGRRWTRSFTDQLYSPIDRSWRTWCRPSPRRGRRWTRCWWRWRRRRPAGPSPASCPRSPPLQPQAPSGGFNTKRESRRACSPVPLQLHAPGARGRGAGAAPSCPRQPRRGGPGRSVLAAVGSNGGQTAVKRLSRRVKGGSNAGQRDG